MVTASHPQHLSSLETRAACFLAAKTVGVIVSLRLPVSILVIDPVPHAHTEQRYILLKLRFGLTAQTTVTIRFAAPQAGLVGIITAVMSVSPLERFATAYSSLAPILGRGAAFLTFLSKTAIISAGFFVLATKIYLKVYLLGADPLSGLGVTEVFFSNLRHDFPVDRHRRAGRIEHHTPTGFAPAS